MKNKFLAMLLASSMVVSMLAGCGSNNSGGNAGTSSNDATEEADDGGGDAAGDTADAGDTASGNPVTINTVSMFGGTDPNVEVYLSINNELMEQYPHISIQDNSQTSDETWKATVAADFSVGNEPDVLQFFTDATANTILAADKFVSLEEIQAVYPEYAGDTTEAALTATTNPDGVRRAVPTTGYWEGLFCNKDLFDEYNLELPTDWNSLVTAIETFKENGIIPIACSLNNVPHYWIEFLMLYAAGPEGYESVPETADVIPEGWAEGLEVFKTLRDMGAFPVDTDTVDDAYVGELFRSKQAAMQLDGSWYAGNITDTENTVVIAFPGIENQKAQKGAMVGGISSGFYITKKAWDDPDKRDAAVKFVMAHTSQAGVQRYWEATGAIAVASTEVEAVEGMTALGLSALEYTNSATSVSAPTDSRLGQEPYGVLVANTVKVSIGDMTAEESITEAINRYISLQ